MVAENLTLMAAALILDALIGDPDALYRHVPHPVAAMGKSLAACDSAFNRDAAPPYARLIWGAVSLIMVLLLFGGAAALIANLVSRSRIGWIVLALFASSLLAQRSLFFHVRAVAVPLQQGDINAARTALARIVGRDVNTLGENAVAGAAIESLSENLSDGVVAPLFWGLVLGFPGLVLYKVVNTADSMLGHRSERHLYFGRAAARFDDVLNFLPARLTGSLIALVSFSPRAWSAMVIDAGKHRSPNAGWPEAAMAGALNVRLSGPRSYHGVQTIEPWLNEKGAPPTSRDLRHALRLMLAVAALLIAATAIAALYFTLNESAVTARIREAHSAVSAQAPSTSPV